MKSPMNQRPDEEAHVATEAFIATYARKPSSEPKAAASAEPEQRSAAKKAKPAAATTERAD
jgi:hypothetical protein